MNTFDLGTLLEESVKAILDCMGGWGSLKLFIEAEEFNYSLDKEYYNVGHLLIKYSSGKILKISFYVFSCIICEIREGEYTKNCRYRLNELLEKRLFVQQLEWIINLKLNPF